MGADGEQSRAEYIIQQLNATNAKKVALLMVLGFIAYHGLIHLRFGSDSCKWILAKGRFKGDREWQPYGCMMHKYSQTDARRCLRYLGFWGRQNHFVFIGDLPIRMIFQSFINQLHPTDDDNGSLFAPDEKNDDEFVDYKLKLQVNYIKANELSNAVLEEFAKYEREEKPPSVVIVGFVHSKFQSGNVTDQLLDAYTANLTRLIPPFDKMVARKAKVLWRLQDHVNEDKLPDELKPLQNDDIDKYNRIAYKVFKYTDAQIWESSNSIANGLLDQAVDGYKLSPLALRHNVQILLNVHCNDYMNFNDGTCCSSAEPYTVLQVLTYAVFGVIITLAVGIFVHRWYLHLRGSTLYMPLSQSTNESAAVAADFSRAIIAAATLGLILAYFYLCDRTNFFMKENKYYSEFSFWIPVGYLFALGLFFTEDSGLTNVLNRDQTEETKGWMLLVILIYYMTGADRVLPIQMHIKVLISAYLFLIGYADFTLIWQTGNAGIVQFCQAMFRTNFITVILCFCMNRPYQFYYFVPLISFWICMVYFLLALPPQITSQSVESNGYHYLYLVLKFVGLLSVVTVLYMSEVFFERIFVTRPWKALFVTTDDDIHDWWYQWKLDRYSVTYGMIFASVFHIAKKNNIFDDNNRGNLFSRRLALIITLAAILGVGFYVSFSFICRNKLDCDEIHSYIVFIPIIGYLVLRNISGILRTRYSSFFAWFGRISLELFICQYHIWLAADRHGVLVLLPGFPTMNMIITTFIFVCASHEVNRLTQVLLPYAIPNDWKIALRNFAIFSIILIPIARSDGMI